MRNNLYKIIDATTGKFLDYVFAPNIIHAEHRAKMALPAGTQIKLEKC